jgi:uncharacterized protein YqgQ
MTTNSKHKRINLRFINSGISERGINLLAAELERMYAVEDMAKEAMLTAREVLMKHHEWMSMNDATSNEDDQEILDVVKLLREASNE